MVYKQINFNDYMYERDPVYDKYPSVDFKAIRDKPLIVIECKFKHSQQYEKDFVIFKSIILETNDVVTSRCMSTPIVNIFKNLLDDFGCIPDIPVVFTLSKNNKGYPQNTMECVDFDGDIPNLEQYRGQ